MAVVVIGVEGSKDVWIADLDAGTVSKLEEVTGELAKANELRNAGATIVKGANLAVAVSTAQEVFSGHVVG